MKESLEQRLEKDRDEVRRQAAMIIRAHLLTFSAKYDHCLKFNHLLLGILKHLKHFLFSCLCFSHRKHFKRVRASVITLQKHLRRHILRKRFVKQRKATLVLQKHRRGQVARARVRKLREEKKKREEEQRKEEEEEKKDQGAKEQDDLKEEVSDQKASVTQNISQ